MFKLYALGGVVALFGYLYFSNMYKESVIEDLEMGIQIQKHKNKVDVFTQYVNDINLTTKEIKDENISYDTSIGSHTIGI